MVLLQSTVPTYERCALNEKRGKKQNHVLNKYKVIDEVCICSPHDIVLFFSFLIQCTALASQGYSVCVTVAQQLIYISRFYLFAALCNSLYCNVATFIRDLSSHFLLF